MIAQANSPAELLKTARECVQRRQFTRARQMLAQLVECEPQNVQGWMLIGRHGRQRFITLQRAGRLLTGCIKFCLNRRFSPPIVFVTCA